VWITGLADGELGLHAGPAGVGFAGASLEGSQAIAEIAIRTTTTGSAWRPHGTGLAVR
jgi:hypothetical protein